MEERHYLLVIRLRCIDPAEEAVDLLGPILFAVGLGYFLLAPRLALLPLVERGQFAVAMVMSLLAAVPATPPSASCARRPPGAWRSPRRPRSPARRDLLEAMTQGPRGDIISVYTTFPWPALCAEVAKLQIEL